MSHVHTPKLRSSRPTRRGFTLVELLVVMGIIIVLASITLPVVSAMRKRVRENACQNNLRQIFQATILVTNDLNGRLPRPCVVNEQAAQHQATLDYAFVMKGSLGGQIDFKVGRLWKYLGTEEARKEVMYCPNDRGERAKFSGGIVDRNFSYSFNAEIRPKPRQTPDPVLRLNHVRRPATRILVFEEVGPNDAWMFNPLRDDDYPTNRHSRGGAVLRTEGVTADPSWKRDGSGNHLFFDGHVELLIPEVVMHVPPGTRGGLPPYYGPLTE